ncbi:hypothetical protein [Amaricoccus sp.]|uniref:hypothetical protein n=1 Tax=Amaricoccus sp. TaxID=1872485 RepID=UPI001B72B217|nr:hypothetical protein [Amaricoccus sp.]MBP7003153.1 hypothetical protein [Amaricoccus sp.]
MSLRLHLLTAALVATTIVADYFLKLASERSPWATSIPFFIGAAIYALSAIGWILAMQEMSLATIAVVYSALTMMMLAGLGAVVFGETLSTREWIGLGLSFGALILMHKPH